MLEAMSGPNPYVQLDRTTHAKLLVLHALRMPSVSEYNSTPFSHDHGIVLHSLSSRVVRFCFSWHPIGSGPLVLTPTPDTPPLLSFSFFWGSGRMHTTPIE